MFLVTRWFGALLVDGKGRVEKEALFPKDARALADLHRRMERSEVLEVEKEIGPPGGFQVLESRLLQLDGASLADGAAAELDSRVEARAKEAGFTPDLMHEAALHLGRAKVRERYASRDLHVVQAVDAIDEIHAQVNLLVERLREWYGLHAPELVARIERGEELAAVVNKHVTRERIAEARPEYAIESAMGGPLGEQEQKALRSLAQSASNLYATRADLEKYLDEAMPEVAPNLTTLLGAVLAARLIRHAGGLPRLAALPAGTIQTLGAEKALFRHLKEGKAPPKHGILLQHPLLHRAPRWQRGSLARALAAKVALAARADALTKNPSVGEGLKEEFEARAARIAKERGKKPARRPTAPRAQRGPPGPRGKFKGKPPRGFQGKGKPQGDGKPRRGFKGKPGWRPKGGERS